MAVQIELTFKAKNDLQRLDPGRDRKAVIDALTVGLAAVPPPGNLDIKALRGAAPWLRLRVGDYRILYRPLTPAELKGLEEWRGVSLSRELRKAVAQAVKQGKSEEQAMEQAVKQMMKQHRRQRRRQRAEAAPEVGYLVARIVHRRELERAVRTLF